jgi:hypothetical protein
MLRVHPKKRKGEVEAAPNKQMNALSLCSGEIDDDAGADG